MRSSSKRKDIPEVTVALLQCISIRKREKKDHIHDYLKYQDGQYSGGMYFPYVELLPFLEAVDVATKDKVNNSKFNQTC